MPLSSRNLILFKSAENTTMLVRRAILSRFITRNRVAYKDMYLARLALDLFWDDNFTIIPEFDFVDAEPPERLLRTVPILSAHHRQPGVSLTPGIL
jgi:hypothetical protein